MAAIGTIRKYSGLAVGLIGVSIVAFIVSDAFQNNSGMFNNNSTDIGEIDGELISYQDFQYRYDIELERYKNKVQSDDVDQGTRDQLRNELWEKIQEEIIYDKEYDAIGITFSSEELTYKVSGPEPHEAVKQFFANPETKEFDRNQMVGFLKNMDDYPEYKDIWLEFETELAKETKRNKYFNLIKAGLNITDIEAKEAHLSSNQFASFEYISLPYKDIQDSTIKVSDEDIKKYFNKHKEDYQIDESRSFDFVVWDIIPSSDDSLSWFTKLDNIRADFAATTKDSTYVELHSDGHFDTLYRNPGHFNSNIDHVFITLKNDDSIVGPYFEDNAFKIAKLIDRKQDTVNYYKASHILIAPKGSTDADTLDAMKKARELMAEAKGGADFTLLAMRNSEDKNSAIKGGDLGWFKDKTMVKPFMDAVKRLKKGDYTVVKSQFGAHLIYLSENPDNTLIKVGIISKEVSPTQETANKVYAEVNKFRSKVNTMDEFEAYVNENGLNKQIANEIRPEEREVPGLINGSALVSWAYKGKLGDISDAFELDDQYAVALLTEVYEKGPAPLAKVSEQVKRMVILEKKKVMLEAKLVDIGGSDLVAIAEAIGGQVDKITDASFENALVAGLGEEKLLIGNVFGSQPNQLSKPIVGKNAVFQFVLKEFSAVEMPEDLTTIKREKTSNFQGMAQFETMESLKELADVKDWRYKFF
ncbi:MAG: hypothetical protein HOF35_04825 [Bacteroidetes bacterium]|nr:hypothetical protein [Bacteroidota bacterium]MBT3933565.1 hypothetical protein [Bacteroidota bacterium]MBT4729405.1 hypothetical protein [Bacteroidota bacterium]MBT4967387.1 hypothetical protein [Bacteroidota bacterium]MBT5990414.1 hypothetical protein [Bacteroidota bacterium]